MKQRLVLTLAALPAVFLSACSGGGGGGGGGGASGQMDLIEVSNGFGLMLPHQVFAVDAQGNPTSNLVAIRNYGDLINNVSSLNPIRPVTEWPTTATLPNGDDGNQFLYAEFKQPIRVDTALDPTPSGQANSGLIGPITVLAVDPTNGQTVPVVGRAFIGGRTYAGQPTGSPPELPFQQWITLDANGKPVANPAIDNEANGAGNGVPDGMGFPGTESVNGFPGANKLVQSNVFVFVVDTDGDLRTHEKFPLNRQIRFKATTALLGQNGNPLLHQVLASNTVGGDTLTPEVEITPPPNSIPIATPSYGDSDVDPQTSIRLQFTEPLQPSSLGSLPTGQPPVVSAAVTVQFGPQTQMTTVPFTILPPSIYDLSVWDLTPVFAFPGNGPATQACGTFNTVTVSVVPAQLGDLKSNVNTLPATTVFTTGEGPGLVNAPVTPDAIYAIRGGAVPGISVVDFNGFGAGTGDPNFDFTYQTFAKGNSNYPNNPNLIFYGPLLYPPIFPGTCTVNGGSAGPFTLTKDSSLNDLLVRPPLITSAGELMIGQSLDLVYHNGHDSTGCRSGGGNFCAITGKKVVQTAFQTGQTLGPPLPNQLPAALVPGGANPISFAPHPNPPPLVFPPLCLQPFIGCDEPTSGWNLLPPPPNGKGPTLGPFTNLLSPGIPIGNANNAPTGIPARFQNSYFVGPDRATEPSAGLCIEYQYRQQIGHFLYMIDRARREIVVFNSNRMTVIDRIPCADPTDLAMGPQLDFLAVSNQNADTVTFIDINPRSANFHQVVKITPVGRGPRGIAWDPGNEDILCCNEEDSSISVISAFTFDVRKVVKSHLNHPFDLIITQRQANFGFARNVYFGWILNRNGDLTLFESGPNGTNGWGYDDTIGVAPFTFTNPKRINVNFESLGGSVWIVHENPLGPNGQETGVTGGAITRIDVDSANFGALPLNGFAGFLNPQFRDMTLRVRVSIGPDVLTGVPVDVALDDMNNLGAMGNYFTGFSVGAAILINGKSYVRPTGGSAQASKTPSFMLAAVPNSTEGPGTIDVIALTSGYTRFDVDGYTPGVQSVPCPGVRYVIDYWRQ